MVVTGGPIVKANAAVQLNVALGRLRHSPIDDARDIFDALAPALSEWRRRGTLRWFFFMRKPPDLRLRFGVANPRAIAALKHRLIELLAPLRRRRAVRRFFFSVYEPETFLFGGADAMDAVHDYFDSDTRAWLRLDRLARRAPATLPAEDLTGTVLHDLFCRTVDDRAEVWDVWCTLDGLAQHATDLGTASSPPLLDDLLEQLDAPLRRILTSYRCANERLSRRLRSTWNRGRLQGGLRRVLSLVARFQLHRHGIPPGRQLALARAMAAGCDPVPLRSSSIPTLRRQEDAA
jgi:thiopeptide-type bacteriocin biosynthesis protein